MLVDLTPGEKEIVKKLVHYQLTALKSIDNKTCDEDLTMWEIENEIENPEKVYNQVRETIGEYEVIDQFPELFLTLPNDDLLILRHILHTMIKGKRYKEGKRGVWRKLLLHENMNFKFFHSFN